MLQIDPVYAIRNAAVILRRKATAFQRGQGMTEYIIIVALIAVAAIGVYQFFGQVVRSQTSAIAREVAGLEGTTAVTAAHTAANATTAERAGKGLTTYVGGAAASTTP